MRLARRDAAGNVYTYLNDPLGSPRYIQGPSNTQAESDWYPFGGEWVISLGQQKSREQEAPGETKPNLAE
jgi:hypothetical protein